MFLCLLGLLFHCFSAMMFTITFYGKPISCITFTVKFYGKHQSGFMGVKIAIYRDTSNFFLSINA